MLKIDLHLHANYPGGPERMRGGTWPTREEIRACYDQWGIEKGVEMPCEAPEHSHDPITTRIAHAITEDYADIAGWWFCYLDPRMAKNSPDTDFAYYAAFYREMGAKGVGEIQANLPILDPRYLALFAGCEKAGMPVTLHLGAPGRFGIVDDLGLPGLETVLKTFPKLKIIGHAASFWSEISGDVGEGNHHGYPTGKVAPGGRLSTLFRTYPNLYADLSAGSGLGALTRDPEFGYRFVSEFADRLFFATDMSAEASITKVTPGICRFLDEGLSSGALDRDAYEKVCRHNAEALLGL